MLADVALRTRPPSSVVRGVGGCEYSRREGCFGFLGSDMHAKYRVAETERVKSAMAFCVPGGGMLVQQSKERLFGDLCPATTQSDPRGAANQERALWGWHLCTVLCTLDFSPVAHLSHNLSRFGKKNQANTGFQRSENLVSSLIKDFLPTLP